MSEENEKPSDWKFEDLGLILKVMTSKYLTDWRRDHRIVYKGVTFHICHGLFSYNVPQSCKEGFITLFNDRFEPLISIHKHRLVKETFHEIIVATMNGHLYHRRSKDGQ